MAGGFWRTLRLGRTIVAVFLILALPACRHDRKAATPPSPAVRTATQASGAALADIGDREGRHVESPSHPGFSGTR